MYGVMNDLLLALELSEGYHFLPRVWSGEFLPLFDPVINFNLRKSVTASICKPQMSNQSRRAVVSQRPNRNVFSCRLNCP